jgi:hypothetical protein
VNIILFIKTGNKSTIIAKKANEKNVTLSIQVGSRKTIHEETSQSCT